MGVYKNELLTPENEASLLKILNQSEVFYNKRLDLRQGAYLTPCPKNLFVLINSIFRNKTGQNLPYLSGIDSEKSIDKNKKFELKDFKDALTKSGLFFNHKIYSRFMSSLLTKPFIILTGLSGSGKTKIAQAFSLWICQSKSQFKLSCGC
jgi:5-methylcytosine-specific restriction enzyme B